MPINSITLENFKGIKGPAKIDLKPITLLFGPNSAGKSTLIQALHYALEIFDKQNLDPGKTIKGGSAVDLGGFESLVRSHDLNIPIKMKFELNVTEWLPVYFEDYIDMGEFQFVDESPTWDIPQRVDSAWVEIAIQWSHQFEKPILREYNIGINGEAFAKISTTDDGKQVFLESLDLIHPVFLDGIDRDDAIGILEKMSIGEDSGEIEFEKLGPLLPLVMASFNFRKDDPGITPLVISDSGSAMPEFGKALQIEQGHWSKGIDRIQQGSIVLCLSSLIVGPGELIRNELRRMLYLGPIREIPSRSYSPEKTNDPSRWASGLMGWDILFKAEKSFIEEANRWLTHEDRLNSGYSIDIKHFKEFDVEDPIMLKLSGLPELDDLVAIHESIAAFPTKSRLCIREEATGIELMAQDIGVGISQVLPVIVGALHLKRGLFAIEQPELHIHPAFQVGLGDLFISRISEASFLIETHSEHLMLRFLRRIRETTEDSLPPGKWPLKPDDLAVYYVEQGKDGVSVHQLRVDEDGEFLDKWPKGFFEERERELL
ncbi:MAG: DUF3696 domain-containing protein [Desulfobacterales bacterium]|nr:DUF3696 domain-containing protein [Desulfobacterales bacterium]